MWESLGRGFGGHEAVGRRGMASRWGGIFGHEAPPVERVNTAKKRGKGRYVGQYRSTPRLFWCWS